MTMQNFSLYSMDLHDQIDIPDGIGYIVRVPNGWVYSIKDGNGTESSVFVAYNDEYLQEEM